MVVWATTLVYHLGGGMSETVDLYERSAAFVKG